MYEAQRHYTILDDAARPSRNTWSATAYGIVDMAVWGWARLIPVALGEDYWAKFPNLKRLVDEISARPAAARANAMKDKHKFKTEFDEEARKAMFKHHGRQGRLMNAGEQQHEQPAAGKRPPRTPKGRQVDPAALAEVRALLTDRPRRRDLLIEHLHLIQDHYGHLSAAHLAALGAEMKMAQTEVYEVATFYSHFDVVKDGPPPPAITVRVCDSLSCAMAGAEKLLKDLPGKLGKNVRVVRAPCMGACDRAPVAAVGHVQTFNATADKVAAAVKAKPHRARLEAGRRFRRLPKARRLRAAERRVSRENARATISSRSSATPACAASAAPAFRPGANGNWCARSPRRACSPSMPTRASPAPSRTASISSAIRTASSRAC